jgi:hypothetical protein
VVMGLSEVLGYDIRCCPEATEMSLQWTDERRSAFLLNSAVRYPASIDTSVWPSVFHYPRTTPLAIRRSNGIAANPKYIQHDLWFSLAEMKKCYEEAFSKGGPSGIKVAISVLGDREPEHGIGLPVQDASPKPARVQRYYSLMGYDVADAGLTSGISNCGYTDAEKNALGPIWKPNLNARGLLRTLESALSFRDLTEVRVPEHAPFYVFALYAVA